ncbi:hypothetical protein HNR67_006694 [Crossiella cryophila]|uniref:Uncharacterized protein n=1 Tax=Crossiella cryophila TaxID=43355 RepID=A0A7W7CG27_9PSEU|nr:hypothetical protein [Crossiella cryophila]
MNTRKAEPINPERHRASTETLHAATRSSRAELVGRASR